MLLACKYEEVSVSVVGDLIFISDRAYTRKEVLEIVTFVCLLIVIYNICGATQYHNQGFKTVVLFGFCLNIENLYLYTSICGATAET